MKIRASSWGGFLLRAALAAAVLVALCWLGMSLTAFQHVRLVLLALFAFSVACGLFAPKGGAGASGRGNPEEPMKAAAENVAETPVETPVETVAVPKPILPKPEPKPEEAKPEPPAAPKREPASAPTEEPVAADANELWERARKMQHRSVPDWREDRAYLTLVTKAAKLGHVEALAKLGEYAMRRRAWVEAYYWMTLAKRGGLPRAEAVLHEIRKGWMVDGFPAQASNVNGSFTADCGSIARALLGIATGRDAVAAREFLKARHPEFL